MSDLCVNGSPQVREQLMAVSATTIDRRLAEARSVTAGRRRRRSLQNGMRGRVPVREGSLVVEALDQLRKALPFPLRGLDTDNGSEFHTAPSGTPAWSRRSVTAWRWGLSWNPL